MELKLLDIALSILLAISLMTGTSLACSTTSTSGTWGDWLAWTSCSATCGIGSQTRSRVCSVTAGNCPGKSISVQLCSASACTSNSGNPAGGNSVSCTGTCKTCTTLYTAGGRVDALYDIRPPGFSTDFEAFCLMDVSQKNNFPYSTDIGGWMMIQRRFRSGVQDFAKVWTDYVNGFGTPNAEYWIGLSKLYEMTNAANAYLRVTLIHTDDTVKHATYSTFKVYGSNTNYQLEVDGFTDGGSGNVLNCPDVGSLTGRQFTTSDKDNDQANGNCATGNAGGFWYSKCGSLMANAIDPWYINCNNVARDFLSNFINQIFNPGANTYKFDLKEVRMFIYLRVN